MKDLRHDSITRQAARHRRARHDRGTELAEDYVEVISDLIATCGEARVVEIAKRLGVSHVTVHRTIARLYKMGLVHSEPYRSVFLTPSGQKLSKSCQERHEIVLSFLLSLGVPEDVATLDAEGIEHHVSKETLRAFSRHLKKGNHL